MPTATTHARRPTDLVFRIQGEFLEMPGLQLTQAQAQRLWGLDATTCAALLAALIASGFLFRTRSGAFMRADGPPPATTSSISH